MIKMRSDNDKVGMSAVGQHKSIAGVVLAGGGSKRFGADKRFYKLDGETLFQISCAKIDETFERKYVVANKDFFSGETMPRGFLHLADIEEGKGPLMGLYTALTRIEEDCCVAIPVDMPALNIELIEHIKSMTQEFDIVVPYSNRPLPLPGAYSKRLVPLIENALECGELSLQNLLRRAMSAEGIAKGIEVLQMKLEDIKRFGDPATILQNINTREQAESYRKS